MRGDSKGAFPIPSLPLKGNKESENTRKHLWMQSLCGFWVSPPSSVPLLPCLWGGAGAAEWWLPAGVWDERSCRLPPWLPSHLGGEQVAPSSLVGLVWCEGCVVSRWGCPGQSKPGGAHSHSLEPGKTLVSGAASCRQCFWSGAPKISLQLQSRTWRILFPLVPGSVFLFHESL